MVEIFINAILWFMLHSAIKNSKTFLLRNFGFSGAFVDKFSCDTDVKC